MKTMICSIPVLFALCLFFTGMIPVKSHADEVKHADEANKVESYTIGLSMYSLRNLFKDGSLKPLDYPAFAKKTFGITEIDIWDGGFPEDKRNNLEFYRELKKRSDAANTNIFLVIKILFLKKNLISITFQKMIILT